ncbi:glycoside hydrolase family 43 protein [Auricularia subglabra TFB-10046 SS5]|nr:glycoside hydrolase family 43 protein [Auricularia subglabra TFB-10046 SS5]
MGADPWVLKHGGAYYLATATDNKAVYVTRSDNLAVWPENGPMVYNGTGQFGAIWAPELHFVRGQFYIYVAMTTPNGDNTFHRMYVLRGTSRTDPTQPFTLVGQITPPDSDEWAIDGTVWDAGLRGLYFIWSGWSSVADRKNQGLYIAPMSDPAHISGSRVLLHYPSLAWQRTSDGASGINEGPQILQGLGRTYLIYSAAGSWTQDYCLAQMSIDFWKDPLVPENWDAKDDGPVFSKSDKVFGVGHACFTTDHLGLPYIIYHGMDTPNGGWNNRSIRAQPFTWNWDGTPEFPTPAGRDVEFRLPF